LAPNWAPKARENLLHFSLDQTLQAKLEPCDVFIFMSGIYLDAVWRAKRRFGARLWLHRGSKHVLVQDDIMAEVPGAERASARVIRRELTGYALADRIVVPSKHSDMSFSSPADRAKLFLNPYGVDLGSFPLVQRDRQNAELELLFVGTWCLRKGCDVLIEAVRTTSRVKLTHVGPVGDLTFPVGDHRFNHIDKVDQLRLKDFYARADAFVLASREEGFGLVLSQALASGLPVICTNETGGPDLAHTPALAERIIVTPAADVGAMSRAVATVRDRILGGTPFPALTESDRCALSWRAYAERHSAELVKDWEKTLPAPPGAKKSEAPSV
jgi:glycosyltransferase involved in cell wall biosynthesis